MEKVIQIAVGTAGEDGNMWTEVVCLTDEGNVYEMKYDIPTKQYRIPKVS